MRVDQPQPPRVGGHPESICICATNPVSERASLLTPIPTPFPCVNLCRPGPLSTVAKSCRDDAHPLAAQEEGLGMLSSQGGFGLKKVVYRRVVAPDCVTKDSVPLSALAHGRIKCGYAPFPPIVRDSLGNGVKFGRQSAQF